MKVLPVGRLDYDLFPLTEEFIEINEDGSETPMLVEKIGVIDVSEDDLDSIGVTKRFTESLDGVEDMSAEEIAEQVNERKCSEDLGEVEGLKARLVTLDHYTNLWVEGTLNEETWSAVVREREGLRQRIGEIRTRYALVENDVRLNDRRNGVSV